MDGERVHSGVAQAPGPASAGASARAPRGVDVPFRDFLDALSDGVFISSEAGGILEANEALCRRLGCDRSQVLGRRPETLYGDSFEGLLAERLSMAGDREPVLLEAVERHDGGSPAVVEMSLQPATYDGHAAVVAVVRDISERRRVEDEQRLAALGQLAAGVAHEFNNLLAAMQMKAEMAALDGAPEGYEALAELVVRSCRRGADICQNMIAFAAPRQPQRELLHIEEPVEAALAIALREMARAEIVVQRDYQATEHRVMADPGQLEQVFLNLFVNACQAMPGGGTLQVATRYESSRGSVVATVSDTGTGIPGEHLPRVFEPFFTTKGQLGLANVPGRGLGLSVTHGIIKAHDGTIRAHSAPGRGTEFIVALPVWRAEPADQTETGEAAAETPAATYRVLIAEDEDDIRNLVAIVLRGRGYEVTVTEDVPQAIQALDTQPFDLIVADWLMPGGTGREIIARAHELPNDPPVVVISGKLGLELVESFEPNVVRCLQKPFDLEDLLESFQMALGRRPSAK